MYKRDLKLNGYSVRLVVAHACIFVKLLQKSRLIVNYRLASPEVLSQLYCVRGTVLQQQLAHLCYRLCMHVCMCKLTFYSATGSRGEILSVWEGGGFRVVVKYRYVRVSGHENFREWTEFSIRLCWDNNVRVCSSFE